MCCIYTFTNNVCVSWLYLTVSDIDGDIVRCRWAESAQNECYGVCQAFPATLDQVSIQPVSLSLIVARRLKHYITLHYCGTLQLALYISQCNYLVYWRRGNWLRTSVYEFNVIMHHITIKNSIHFCVANELHITRVMLMERSGGKDAIHRTPSAITH